MGDASRKSAVFEQLARVGKAMGNGKRLELLDLLAQAEHTVEALSAAAGIGLTTVSTHLQTLKAAGLVATRREGTKIHYRLAGEDVAALYASMRQVAGDRVADVERAATDYLGEGTRTVGREEFLARLEHGDLVVLDVRPAEEYFAGHIPGAVSIPVEQLRSRLDELPPEAEIVAYCRGAYCVFAHDAVRLLTAEGRNAARLDEGMLEWRVAGLPIAS